MFVDSSINTRDCVIYSLVKGNRQVKDVGWTKKINKIMRPSRLWLKKQEKRKMKEKRRKVNKTKKNCDERNWFIASKFAVIFVVVTVIPIRASPLSSSSLLTCRLSLIINNSHSSRRVAWLVHWLTVCVSSVTIFSCHKYQSLVVISEAAIGIFCDKAHQGKLIRNIISVVAPLHHLLCDWSCHFVLFYWFRWTAAFGVWLIVLSW